MPHVHSYRAGIAAAFVAAASMGASVTLARAQQPRAGQPQIAIEPMTRVDPRTGTGYFSDPYPIHVPPLWINASLPPAFSGTTKAILRCWHGLQAECFQSTPLSIGAGTLADAARAQGSVVTGTFENNNIFRDRTGLWHMASTMYLRSLTHPNAGHWNAIVHAHPIAVSYGVPTEWVADTVLIGSLSEPAKANYDGKYFEDSGRLYLLYSKRLSDQPARDGIVAQLMRSPVEPAPAVPVVLLRPEDKDGGYNSEYFHDQEPSDQFKLVETGNVSVVDGKYALAYSTGAYDQPDYKAGVAWSDSFLPAAGSAYRRILERDAVGIWGRPNHPEVRYLLQAEKKDWPNYVAAQVLAPGVPSIVRDERGWFLFFAAYSPADAPTLSATGDFEASHRRPYFVRLKVSIPPDASVASASAAELATWVEPVTR